MRMYEEFWGLRVLPTFHMTRKLIPSRTLNVAIWFRRTSTACTHMKMTHLVVHCHWPRKRRLLSELCMYVYILQIFTLRFLIIFINNTMEHEKFTENENVWMTFSGLSLWFMIWAFPGPFFLLISTNKAAAKYQWEFRILITLELPHPSRAHKYRYLATCETQAVSCLWVR